MTLISSTNLEKSQPGCNLSKLWDRNLTIKNILVLYSGHTLWSGKSCCISDVQSPYFTASAKKAEEIMSLRSIRKIKTSKYIESVRIFFKLNLLDLLGYRNLSHVSTNERVCDKVISSHGNEWALKIPQMSKRESSSPNEVSLTLFRE